MKLKYKSRIIWMNFASVVIGLILVVSKYWPDFKLNLGAIVLCLFFIGIGISTINKVVRGYIIIGEQSLTDNTMWPTRIQIKDIKEVKKVRHGDIAIITDTKKVILNLGLFNEEGRLKMEEFLRKYMDL